MEAVIVKVRRADDSIEEARLQYTDEEHPHMRLELSGAVPIEAQDSDLFECLCRIREALESRGELILVQGARRDVFRSAMSRDMANGKLAYVHVMGQQGRKEDIVCIFDYADESLIGTVEEQRAYHYRWLDSL